jgi:L-lactate permease
MNWTFLLAGFALSLFMGAALVTLLGGLRPQWSSTRRRFIAASVLPAVTLVATLCGLAFISTADHGQGQTMEDLALRALATIGAGFALLALIGGWIGAALAQRRRGG